MEKHILVRNLDVALDGSSATLPKLDRHELSEIVNQYAALDKSFLKIAGIVDPIRYFTAINQRDLNAKLANGEHLDWTAIRYERLPDGLSWCKKKLLEMVVPERHPIISKIYGDMRGSLLRCTGLINGRGQPDAVREISNQIYSLPDGELIGLAKKILQNEPTTEEPIHHYKRLEMVLEESMAAQNLKKWRVRLSKKHTVAVNPIGRYIRICNGRKYTDSELSRLPEHEIIHAIRAENGYAQKLGVFSFGIAGYEATEEGLAILAEKAAGVLSVNTMRRYAGRVLAIQSAASGDKLYQTYELLREWGFSPTAASQTSVRAHRGGGFFKDSIYLSGWMDVEKYLTQGGDLSLLFVGKIGVNDSAHIDQLLREGIILPPRCVPNLKTHCLFTARKSLATNA